VKSQKWLIFFVVLTLIAGTAGALNWLKGRQKLGRPGIKATPVPGSMTMKIDLPERALDFTSTNVPESEIELSYFPKDTSYARRHYQTPDGFDVTATVVLMGADRTSIHRPEYCMPGQGWHIDKKTEVNIPVDGPHPYGLPVMKWVVSNFSQTPDGRKIAVRGLLVFWFVAEKEQTADYVRFQYFLVRDLLLTGVLQRWAYITYFSYCEPGQEEATFERMKKLIAVSVPEYQLMPKGKNIATAGH
jgi:hypothetical protein